MGDIRIYVATDDQERAMQMLQKRDNEYQRLDDDEETLVTDDGPADVDENAPAVNDDGTSS